MSFDTLIKPSATLCDWSKDRFSLDNLTLLEQLNSYPPSIQRSRLERRYIEIQSTLKRSIEGKSIPLDTVDKIEMLLEDFDTIVSVFDKVYDSIIKEWFKKGMYFLSHQGAVLGSGKAAYVAGKIYYRKMIDDERFVDDAKQYFSLAVKNGCPLGNLGFVAVLLSSKEEFSDDQKVSIKTTLEMYAGSNPDADIMLGILCYTGRCSVSVDYDRAFKLLAPYREINAFAQLYLGRMYMYGRGCESLPKHAYDLLWKSSIRGNKVAQEYLNEWFE